MSGTINTAIVKTDRGANGADASSGRAGGNGGTGPDFTIRSSGNLNGGQGQAGPAARAGADVQSMGGNGGKAYGNTVLSNQSAGRGGTGGAITFVQQGEIGKTDIAAKSLIVLRSAGGAGGLYDLYGIFGGYQPGGAGGNGGTVTFEAQKSIGAAGAALGVVHAVSQGGKGSGSGAGGRGGAVTVRIGRNATLSSVGKMSPAIVAEARGGDGADSQMGNYRQIHGGAGGDAGGGIHEANVIFVSEGTIATTGDLSPAVLLQSVGGNGARGDGGGDGGAGGSGSKIDAKQSGTVSTTGLYSFGVVAQSVGGSGGKGGRGFFTGAPGGSAGHGGDVAIVNSGTVTTEGESATAIVAQSIGGGRALDAFAVQPVTPGAAAGGGGGGAGGSATSPFFSEGGRGGTGGDGGAVRLRNDGAIETKGASAYGLFAQSVGGSGGAGGEATSAGLFFSLALGGSGGGGGNGGAVLVERSAGAAAGITTSGKNASAIFAQSIGGGGGAGGSAWSGALGSIVSISVAVGGSGGKGGKGGEVHIDNTSSLVTHGEAASGIEAQSVGGGGGTAGRASSYAVATAAPGANYPSIAVAVAVGGSGGDGGSGGAVSLDNAASISTGGRNAHGIDARSVGGGGGAGGAAASHALAVPTGPNVALSVSSSVGGKGGKGGDGGAVTVENKGAGKIVTRGTEAAGLRAISVGGGGGIGGGAEGISDLLGYYKTIAGAFALGGGGGGGGVGGAVTADNRGTIETWGQFANGISALSVGGGGGVGGTADTAASAGLSTGLKWNKEIGDVIKTLPLADAITFTVTLGGAGGDGGDGGAVSIKNFNRVHTGGTNATALQAVSIGGGGGLGGGFAGGGEGDMAGNFKLGGKGGKGGKGGGVTVDNARGASIETELDGAHGIVAVSVGGGGGVGGAFTGKRESAAPNFPTSGSAEDIYKYVVTITDEVLKSNKVAKTLLKARVPAYFGKEAKLQEYSGYVKSVMATAKSIARNDPGEWVSWRNSIGAIATLTQLKYQKQLKDWAKQNLAAHGKKDWDVPNASIHFTNGGSGGGGGAGGAVNVSNSGTVTTHGDLSYAILAQSVGGGGGTGGAAYATGNSVFNLNITNGGSGGGGGAGGTVSVTNGGAIATEGLASYGIMAQSVGGGGGIAGGSTQQNTLSLSANINLGGSGGQASSGGQVEVVNSGAITTKGDEAHGIVAQSVGGGGGSFFINQAALASLPTAVPKELQDALKAVNDFVATVTGKPEAVNGPEYVVDGTNTILPTPSVNLSLGGTGTSGGSGGAVDVRNSGRIATSGLGAFGIFAQSIGGGGGMGTSGKGDALVSLNAQLGGSGGAAGDGGRVKVELEKGASISTSGDGAHGIFAQSVGGGGGYGGTGRFSAFKLGVSPNRGGGSAGNGGRIDVVMAVRGDGMEIATTGKRAHGIFAQSLGGGGGLISNLNGSVLPEKTGTAARSDARGSGGGIRVDVAGRISATGAESYGIFAQSGQQKADGILADTAGTGQEVSIRYAGLLTGGAGGGAAIRSDTTGRTLVTLLGSDSVMTALSGTAITAPFGETDISNSGTIIGDVRVNRGEFVNRAGAVYQSRADGEIRLGNESFLNEGTFDIGGVGKISTATIGGSYRGGAGSRLLVDISPASGAGGQASDLLVATQGATFERGAFVQPNAITWLLPGTYTFLRASNGAISGSPAITGVKEVAVPITWTIATARAASGAAEMSLTPQADFTNPRGVTLSQDERAVAGTLQSAWNAASKEQATLFPRFLSIASAKDYAQALDGLSADDNADQTTSSVMETRAGLKAAMSCPAFVDASTLIREGDCMWARIIGGHASMSGSALDDGFTQDSLTYRIGGQHEFMENWFAGFSVGYTQGWMDDSVGASSSTSSTLNGALALKYQAGPWLFALSAALGNTWQDNTRSIAIGTTSATALSDSQLLDAGLKLRGAYEFAFSQWYVRPYLDLDALYIHQPAYAEHGAPGFNLNVSSAQKTLFAVNPSVEVGGRIDLEQGYWLRPFASVGYTLLSSGTFTTTSSLQGAPLAVGTFETATRLPDNLLDLGLGFQLASGQGLDVTAEYQAQIASGYLAQWGSLKLAVRF